MLFDVKQFEQVLNERILKKGLRLFEKGELEFIERLPGFEYHFSVNTVKLLLKKKGDKLLSYTCSCPNTSYCEHLSAALFYFQQEALGISARKKLPGKKNSTVNNAATYSTLKKAETQTLLKFLKENKNQISQAGASSFLADKVTIGFTDIYTAQFGSILEPYLSQKKLDQKTTLKLKNEIDDLIKKIEEGFKRKKDSFFLNLAIVETYSLIFNMRFSGNEEPVFEIYHAAIKKLEKDFKNGLSGAEERQWLRTILNVVESNKNLQSESFLFLIPRFASIAKNESDLALLTSILKKRVYKIPYSHAFDKLLIARFEVALKEWKLFHVAFPLHEGAGEIELIIAKAELDLCGGKMQKAFKILEENYESVRTIYKNYYNDYLQYILVNARNYDLKELEIKYLRESFIQNLFILPDQLDRFLELLPEEDHLETLQELIERIRTKSKGYHFDKISMLLQKANLNDELIKELAKESNKFSLVHAIALKKLPEYTTNFLTLYMRHLAETLRQDSIYNYQVQVFNTAKEYLDQLPEKLVIELIKKLLDRIGKTGHLYRYINEMYDYPFLKENENY